MKHQCKNCRFFDPTNKKLFELFDPNEGPTTTTVSNESGLGICKWGEEYLAIPYQTLGTLWVPWVAIDTENCPTFEPKVTN